MRGLRRATAFLRAELRPIRSLIPLIVLSLLIAFALTRGRVSLAYPAFQSPVTTPTTAPQATATATPAGVPTGAPTETEIPAVPSPGVSTPSAPSVETPPVAPSSPTISTEPVPSVEEEPARSPGPPWAIFIDTCVVGFSYLWLFCGGIVLMLFVLGAVASFLLRRA